MHLTDSNNTRDCRSEEIAAYLDGELDDVARVLFESHLKGCDSCSAELLEQRRLLCALDFAFSEEDAPLALPQNFAQVVAANAESDMSGVRGGAEHGRAIRVCAALMLLAFALLGGASLSESIYAPVRIIARYAASLAGLLWHSLYDACAGLFIILRAVSRHFIFDSPPLSLFAGLLFALALALLPRLIVKYHRTRITE